jgi:hypothetical protein
MNSKTNLVILLVCMTSFLLFLGSLKFGLPCAAAGGMILALAAVYPTTKL